MDGQPHSRRTFIATAAASATVFGFGRALGAPAQEEQNAGGNVKRSLRRPEQVNGIPYRDFGKTGEKVSLLAVGGHHIGRPDEQTSIRLIREALDNGVNFLDNAWDYHHGESEVRMGKALQEGYREKAFLMTKHHGRKTKKEALDQLDESLKRLKTDYIDLWQYHEVVYDSDPQMIFSAGGAIEAADVAKKQGKVRYVGFTGHKTPMLHLQMLAYDYPWDSVQMPLNPFDATYLSFEQWVLPVLQRRNIACIAMKTRGGGQLLKTNSVSAEELWRYVTALPVATVVSGMESLELLRDNLRLARELQPMDEQEMAALRQKVKDLAAGGEHEKYKTTRQYDGWKGREIHGIKS